MKYRTTDTITDITTKISDNSGLIVIAIIITCAEEKPGEQLCMAAQNYCRMSVQNGKSAQALQHILCKQLQVKLNLLYMMTGKKASRKSKNHCGIGIYLL